MSRAAQLQEAARRHEEFTGHKATRVLRRKLDDFGDTGYKLGPMVGIAYRAKRDGKVHDYLHEFATPSAPELVVSSDGGKLAIVGGRFRVTNHGIEDR